CLRSCFSIQAPPVIQGNPCGSATSVIPYDYLTPRFFQPSSQGINRDSLFLRHISQVNSSDQHSRDTRDERREPRISLFHNQRDDQKRHNINDFNHWIDRWTSR